MECGDLAKPKTVTVNSETTSAVAKSHGISLVLREQNKKTFACGIEFEGWEYGPAQGQRVTVLRFSEATHDLPKLLGKYVEDALGPIFSHHGQSSRELRLNQSREILCKKIIAE